MSIMETEIVDIGVTICSVCGGNEDEDLVLLCDGVGCSNEIHMFCLKPLVTEVPHGDWYCPMCDPDGTTLHLERMIQSHNKSFQRESISNKDSYQRYLAMVQQNHYPFENWKPNILDNRVLSEFDISSSNFVGMPLKIYSQVDDQIHNGRIISHRYDEVLARTLHLVQFRWYRLAILTFVVTCFLLSSSHQFPSDDALFHEGS